MPTPMATSHAQAVRAPRTSETMLARDWNARTRAYSGGTVRRSGIRAWRTRPSHLRQCGVRDAAVFRGTKRRPIVRAAAAAAVATTGKVVVIAAGKDAGGAAGGGAETVPVEGKDAGGGDGDGAAEEPTPA